MLIKSAWSLPQVREHQNGLTSSYPNDMHARCHDWCRSAEPGPYPLESHLIEAGGNRIDSRIVKLLQARIPLYRCGSGVLPDVLPSSLPIRSVLLTWD